MLIAAAITLAVAGALLALMLWLQTVMAFPSPPASAQVPQALQEAGGRAVWLDVDGDRVEAWFLPAPGGRAPLLINAHGNGELIDQWPARMAPLRDAGVAVLLVEYPGYGRSGGTPSERSITATMLAAYDWAVRQPEIDARRIIAHGRSMGGGAVAQLASRRPVAALLLESTYTSLAEMIGAFGVPDFLIVNRLDTRAVLARFSGPVLIMHGSRDVNILPDHARGLAAALPRARLEWLDCGHNDCPPQWELVLGFLAENGVISAPAMGDRP
jgi:uncharacterized protein